MDDIFFQQNKIADEIFELRKSGDLINAIQKCRDAIASYPQNNFFHKILGDIYLQNGNIENACVEYIENLKLISERPYLFKGFIKFFRSLERIASDAQIVFFKEKIKTAIQVNSFSEEITHKLVTFLGSDIILDKKLMAFLPLSNDDKNLQTIINTVNKWEQEHKHANIQALITHKLNARDYSRSKKIDIELILFLERTKRFESALALIEVSQQPYNFTMQSRILRICRRLTNYDVAERLLKIDETFIEKSDFNVQYELVYYFQTKNDTANLEKVFHEIRRSARHSLPIAKTLYNFYLSFNKFDEAKTLYEYIEQLQITHKNTGKRRQAEQSESEQIVWQRLKDLVSDQEHNRQMIALRDLLKGFSHELGQPITNIRYGVQLQKIKIEKGVDTREELKDLLSMILMQTARIGNMLERFRPIVSSKSESTVFCLKNCIQKVFDDMQSRLKNQNIIYEISGSEDIKLYGDSVQFSQVFYNLVLNAMQAIDKDGKIIVDIVCIRDNVKIYFSDNGPGIPLEYHQKIFEPFFSTKDPTAGNGGEGLGLFIVWNILKMFGGTIFIDKKYHKGAKFVITIPITREEHTINE